MEQEPPELPIPVRPNGVSNLMAVTAILGATGIPVPSFQHLKEPRLLDRQCFECGREIPPGRDGRRCKVCRETSNSGVAEVLIESKPRT